MVVRTIQIMVIRKELLNQLGTTFGAIAGIATMLGTNNLVDKNIAGAVGGVATILLGIVTQQPSKEFTAVTKAILPEEDISAN
jgi:hypothetical protein